MTEKNLIDFLSNESEKMDNLFIDDKIVFDTGICGWKDSPINSLVSSKSLQGPASFRIRTAEKTPKLFRNSSHRSSLKFFSSSEGSRNTSPGENPKKSSLNLYKETKKRLPSMFYQIYNESSMPTAVSSFNLRVHPPRAKKRKPVKAFKILKENDE